MNDSSSAGWRRAGRRVWPLAFLIGLLWLVRYARSAEFGLYEDDLTYIPTPAQMTPAELLPATAGLVREFRQGTPLELPVLDWMVYLGWAAGGLRGLYFLGFLILALNVCLFVLVVRRVGGWQLATLAGLAYVLYSADTTQAYLTHSFTLQVSITMLLAALLCYLQQWKVAAYAFIVAALLTYETTFLVFLAAPLLRRPWDRAWRKEAVGHVAVCLVLLGGVVGLRAAMGERRVTSVALRDLATVPITHMLIGPAVALGTYLLRPVQAIQSLRWDVLLASLAAGSLIAAVLWRLQEAPGPSGTTWDRGRLFRPRDLWLSLADEQRALLQTGLAGFAMLVLAYPITFTVRPYAISGRDTRVHAAGVVGASIVVGSALALGLGVARTGRRRAWGVAACGLSLGLLAGYGLVIQDDYATAWRLQRAFWTALLPLIPDVEDGTAIVVDPTALQDTRQIGANYWNLPRVLGQLFRFPSSWEGVPRVYRLADGWQNNILTEDGSIRLDAATTVAPPSSYRVVDPAQLIFIGHQQGELRRLAGAFPPDDGGIDLPAIPVVGEPPFAHGFLYPLMIQRAQAAE